MRGMRVMNCVGLVLAVVAASMLAAPAWAQTDVTTSRVTGIVKDTNGQPLPGATVEAKNQDTSLVGRAVTEADGTYRVLNLPPGLYTVSASLEGFVTATRESVRLTVQSVPTVEFTLQQAQFAEQVTVTSEVPLVEVTNTTAGTTVVTEQLASLPINGRDFTSLVYMTPESRKETQRGYITLSGQRGVNTNVTIDGLDYNNAFFGGTAGTAEGRAPLSVSVESIKEFAVITNGASAELGRSGGGFVNVITKSGSNTLHGSAFYYYQPQDLIADLPGGVKPRDQSRDQFGASLGGPIMKDKLFFFAAYDENKQDQTIPIDPRVLDAGVFAAYPQLASGPSFVQTKNGRTFFGRVDYNLSTNQRLMARMNYADYLGNNGSYDTGARAESHNGIEHMWSRTYAANWSSVWGDNLINDLNMQYTPEATPRDDKGLGFPEIQVQSPSARYGEVAFLPITAKQYRKTVADSMTYMWHDHVVKGGFEYNDTNMDQIFKGNWRGVFIFDNYAALIAGKWKEYRQFGGLNGLTADEAGRSDFGQKELAFYLQDQWYINPTLTVSFGLRWEKIDNPDIGILNPDDQNANGSFKLSRGIPDQSNMWSPRLGISWQLLPKSALKFSAGRFWSRTPALLFAQVNTSNGYKGTQYTCRASASAPPTDSLCQTVVWGAGWTPDGTARIDFSTVPNPTKIGVFTFDPDYKNAHTDRFTLEWEQEVLANTGVTLGATYAESKDLEYLSDSNLQYACADGTYGLNCEPKLAPNGMPLYGGTAHRLYPYYDRINTYMSGARSKYFGLSALVQRRFVESFFGWLSVTYSKDKDSDSNERNYSGLFIEDKNDLENNYGYADRDQRWKIAANGTWNMPWWGLQLSGLYRFNSGQPFTPLANSDLNADGDSGTDRPTVDGEHLGRNSFRNPAYYQIDLGLSKKFALGPGDLAVVAQCFNVTDNEGYYVSGTSWGTGATPLAAFGTKTYNGTPRTYQLALRYDF